MATRVVYVKSVKDYEEVPDHGETLIFREKGAEEEEDEDENEEIEEEDEEIEETLRADWAVLGSLLE
jgi:hypothetical protein